MRLGKASAVFSVLSRSLRISFVIIPLLFVSQSIPLCQDSCRL